MEQVAYRRVTNGISLCKSFDAYRSWVIVESGHFDAIQLPDGTLRKHPRSISFANMDEFEFQQLYKAALDVLWRWVLSRSFRSRDEAENVAAQLLTGCGITRTVYVQVPAVPLAANLTDETPQPAIPEPLTYGASLDLNFSLLSALGQCNIDKASIREIEVSGASH